MTFPLKVTGLFIEPYVIQNGSHPKKWNINQCVIKFPSLFWKDFDFWLNLSYLSLHSSSHVSLRLSCHPGTIPSHLCQRRARGGPGAGRMMLCTFFIPLKNCYSTHPLVPHICYGCEAVKESVSSHTSVTGVKPWKSLYHLPPLRFCLTADRMTEYIRLGEVTEYHLKVWCRPHVPTAWHDYWRILETSEDQRGMVPCRWNIQSFRE